MKIIAIVNKTFLMLIAFGLVGCVTMLTHVPLTHEQTISVAEELATYDSCAEQKYAQKESVIAHKSAVAQMLTVSSYNKDTFAAHYELEMHYLKNSNSFAFKRKCTQFQASAVEKTNNLLERYQVISAQRTRDAWNMVGSANSFSPPVYASPMPSVTNTQPNFGIQKGGSSNYLVNTPSGFRQCSITSGVAMCR